MERRSWRAAVRAVTGGTAALLALATVPVSSAGAEQPATTDGGHPIRSCATLAEVTWPDGSRVTSTTDVPANGATPQYCNVTLLVPDRINIIVGLPDANWNGRYQAMGTGGLGGSVNGSLPNVPGAIAAGYATSVTDTGHAGDPFTGEWAWSPTGMNYNLIQDYAYRANHEMALKTKDLIRLYYGRAPDYSYWNGCSNGGREGLTEAMRNPDDFDGIVAGAPAVNATRLAPGMEWPPLVMNWMGHYLPTCKEDAVTKAVMEACNGTADGAQDGLIDPTTCNFDPKSLLGLKTPCGTITALDVELIEKIWQGPRDQQGGFLWYGLVPGASFWQLQGLPYLGVASTASMPIAGDPLGVALTAIPFPIGDDFLRYFIHKDPSWNYRQESYDQYVKDFHASETEWGTYLSVDPDLTAFSSRGGKLILWHGLADPLIPPQGTLNYYKRVLDTMGASKVAGFARLFFAPNVDHCLGGTGPEPDDPLAAVVQWREQGVPPETLAASGTNVAGQPITRDLCPYPQRMAYNGSGDVLAARSFHCTRRPLAAGN